MIKFLDNKLFRYLSVFLFLNSSILPVKSSSALAAWAINTNGVLELRTKSNTNLKAYFQKANQISGDRFWVDFPGELINPRTIKGNSKANQNVIHKKKNNYGYLKLPEVKRNKFEVVIDPGHGGPDPGAIGIGGIRETDVVLEVSKIVKNLLSEKGVKVSLTRTNDVDLDLPPRVSIANNTDADIFVSIHANASRGKRRDINGLETFYYRGWRGRLLAKRIQKQILRVSPGSPDRGVKQGRFYVIKNTMMPAVLVEIGFLTGRLDARRLEKITHRKRLAYAIAKGILEYLDKVG